MRVYHIKAVEWYFFKLLLLTKQNVLFENRIEMHKHFI